MTFSLCIGCVVDTEDPGADSEVYERDVEKSTYYMTSYYPAVAVCGPCDRDETNDNYFDRNRDSVLNGSTTDALDVCCAIPMVLALGSDPDPDYYFGPDDITSIFMYGVCGNNDGANDDDEYEAWLYSRDPVDTTPNYINRITITSCGTTAIRYNSWYNLNIPWDDVFLSVEVHLPHVDSGRVSSLIGFEVRYDD